MSSQQPAFHFGGQAPSQPPPPQQNYAQTQTQPPTNGTSVVSSQPQQMAFQQNAALPGIDLSALQGINISAEQLMAIAHLLQTGQLTLPPPAPGPDSTPSAFPAAAATPASTVAPQAIATSNHRGDDVNMDREEGELEDDEEEEAPDSHAHVSTSAGDSQSKMDRSLPAPAAGQKSVQAAPLRSSPAQNTATLSRVQSMNGGHVTTQVANVIDPPRSSNPQPSMAVKAFVLELHRVGYGFEDLAREVGNTPSLRKLYQQIGIPLSPKPSGPLTAASDAPKFAAQIPQAEAQRQTSGSQPIASKPAATATAPAKPDRASYLAKLQAAKNKKSESVVESPTASLVQSPAVPAAVPAQTPLPTANARTPQHITPQHVGATAPQPAATTVASPARTPKIAVDRELIRQRLAKLQAERAAAQNAQQPPNDAAMPDRSSGNTQQEQAAPSGPSVPLAISTGPQQTPTMNPSPPRSFAAASPSIARGSGLPGLFTTRAPVQQSSSPGGPAAEAPIHAHIPMQSQPAVQTHGQSPANSPAPLHLPRQRPMNGQQAPWTSTSAPNRSFGNSGMQNEAFIIETSSDDDDSEDMDTDDSGQQSPEHETKPLSARPVGHIPDFPPSRLDPQRATSTPGTPSNDLKRKLEELEAARQQLEALKRRKVSVKSTGNTHITSTQSPGAAATARSSISTPDAATPNADLGVPSSSAAAHPNKQQEKEALRKRLKELETSLRRKLPGASIAPEPPAETVAQPAPQQPEEDAAGAADRVDDDNEDDGDLYGSENNEPIAEEVTSAPSVNPDVQDSEDEDGEIYEPQSFDSAGDADTRPLIRSDNDKIGSQATTQSATTNADAADTQLAAEMDAAMTEGATDAGWIEHTSPAQQKSEAFEVGNGIEDGEVADDDSEDMYEPAAAHQSEQSVLSNDIPPAKIEQNEAEEDEHNEAMDISSDDSDSDSSSDESSDDYEPVQDVVPESSDLPEAPGVAGNHADEDVNGSEPEPTRPVTDDDLAPELQPTEEQHVAATQPAPSTGFYKPYTSMLSRFKEYRYHPDFIDNVSGGHQSLTYSNNIDHEKPICPFEIGGRCNDKDCQFQHFKTSEC